MIKEGDPIFALATPRGKSAIGVFRISGKNSHKIIKKLSSKKKWKNNETKTNYILGEAKEKIDQTLTTFFNSPHTYTGENMVEISCHGSLATINKISEIFIKNKLRQAEPGEFTKRSLLNDKIDVTQAEGVSDLVNAETEKQRIVALKNLEGGVSAFSKKISKKIIRMIANIEAIIDFSDEELPKNILLKIKEQNKNIINVIKQNLVKSKLAKSIRNGFLVSIVGKPNTGKSSFINYISGRDVSIVTNIPGTTTDSLEVPLDIDGYKFRFMDTAGIRKHKNLIEKLGIEKTQKNSLISDLNIVFLEQNETNMYKDIPNKIYVKSKQDLRKKRNNKRGLIEISSKTGFGTRRLIKLIKSRLINSDLEKTTIFSRERHIEKTQKCLFILDSIDFNRSPDLIAEDMRAALKQNEEIYQKFDIEKILDIIFADFCIGK
ncbi:MAG: tRNA modification GTPase MnmE [Alphaproteobacteria bacterium MarineAlpha5_Bin5]|nr:MAG: tRNA modification GTPase MnmE [Alphaproteobacteria bacterium MarineAlpha5_Bin5]PPR52715.1 MAG: tRNA modification GTPase MnmE [Alphaproteobacteria bacterium MarineAlpha5_Bin4]|tara:strand:+ start:2571 stop:3872 length:1302 start_codon:yes stop_codon:yes gene_type:complete